jgi:hypothetical protein
MTDRALRDLCPVAGTSFQSHQARDAPVGVLRLRQPNCDVSLGGQIASSDTPYLALAFASRQAAGLPDEIADHEPWKVFARAISHGGPPLGPLRTSGVSKRCGLDVVPHLTAAEAVSVAVHVALPVNGRAGHRPR